MNLTVFDKNMIIDRRIT